MKTIALIMTMTVMAVAALAAPPPPPNPAVANPFTTNRPPATITNSVPIHQNNYIEVNPPLPGPATNFWGSSVVKQKIDGLISATNIVNGMVNGRGFGALGDGTTDDRETLQKGIDVVSDANATLYLGSGIFKLSDSLVINGSCRIFGVGATILVPNTVPAIILNNFTNGTIQGVRFLNTSTTGYPATAIYGATNNLSGIQILNNRFTRCRMILRDQAIFDTVPGNIDAKITGNTWDGNMGMDSFLADVSQCIDLRGFRGAIVEGNFFNVTDEERFAHFSGCYDISVKGNVFTSLRSTNATVAIDFFADCRKIDLSYNIFTMTNTTCQVVLYGKASGAGPEGNIESQHTGVINNGNIIDLSTSDVNAIGIASYGPWGQPDETIPVSTFTANDNSITIRSESPNPGILARGFTSATLDANIIAGTNTQAFKHGIEVDNCHTATITDNTIDQGRITVQGVSFSPQAIQYEKLPVNVTISDNTIKSFKQLGGIWISQCTNLANLNINDNTIWTSPTSSSSSGLIYLYQSPGITNVNVMGTLGFAENGNHYTLEASTTVANPTVVNNFWQAVGEVYSVVPATTNIVIDFKKAQFQTTFYLNDTTNANLHFSVTNCLPGKHPVYYRLQAGATNRNLTFDSAFALQQGYPTMVGSNRTVAITFWSYSTNCGNANVVVMPWLQGADDMPLTYRNLTVNKVTRPDSSAIVSFNSDNVFGAITPFQHASTNVGGVGWIASTDTMGFIARDLGTRTFSVDNDGNSTAAGYLAAMADLYLFTNNSQMYGRNAANSAYIPLIKVGADDAIRIGSATDKTSVDYALSVGWGGVGRTDANGGQVMLDVNGRIASVQTTADLTADDQSFTVSMNHLLIASDNGTPANRTFTLNNSGVYGQHLYLILTAGAAQLVDDSSITGGTGTVKLSANWEPGEWDSLHLYCDGTNWVEISRSAN